jgi:transposase InsO family protein
MSKKGDCYDNAAMESWNHSLKVEAIHGERFLTRHQAKQQVFEYIEGTTIANGFILNWAICRLKLMN